LLFSQLLAQEDRLFRKTVLFRKEEEAMALVLKGGEFIATEALSASALSGLMSLARRRPLVINGMELQHEDLAKLVEEVQLTGQPVWPRLSDKL
jgi:hypothetical protein